MKQKIQEATHYLSLIENIEYGGCLIAVWSIYLYLKKFGFSLDNFQFVSLNIQIKQFKEYHENNKIYIKNPDIKDAYPARHFGWTLNGGKNVEDIEGEINKKHYPLILYIPSDLTEKFATDSINNIKEWNNKFDRRKFIPEIEETLQINLGIKLNYKYEYTFL